MTELSTLSPQQAAAREAVIGSSEAAALYELSPYFSKRELFEIKIGREVPQREYSVLMDYGSRLEPVIAAWTADLMGWTVHKVVRPVQHRRCKGWGASLDYEIVKHPRGPGVLECKAVVWTASGWVEEDGQLEAPEHIEIQLAHQLGAIGREWGAIAAMIGAGRPPVVIQRTYDPKFEARHTELVEEFWDRIKRDDPWPVNPDRDKRLVGRMFPHSIPEKLLDAAALSRAEIATLYELARERCELKEQIKHLQEGVDRRETALKAALGDAEGVELPCPGGGSPLRVTWKTQERPEYTVPAASFRVLRIAEVKAAKGKRR